MCTMFARCQAGSGRGRSASVTSAVSRRDRLRGSTLDEILEVARRQLVAAGPSGISLRAIAREMGMTAPALYRYFDSLDDLVVALVAACYDDLTAAIVAERDRHLDEPVGVRMVESCRVFRRWALEHRPEFNLLFGTPIPDLNLDPEGPAEMAGRRFGGVFGAMFVELWTTSPFPVPRPDDIEPRLAEPDDADRHVGVLHGVQQTFAGGEAGERLAAVDRVEHRPDASRRRAFACPAR